MAALLDFGKHQGRKLGSVPSNYLRWIVNELPQPKLGGWKVLAQEELKERIRKEEESSRKNAGDNAAALKLALPDFDPAKTVLQFGKFKGKELGEVPSGYLKYVVTELAEGKRATWALVAEKFLEHREAQMRGQVQELLKARESETCSNFGLGPSTTLDATGYTTLLKQCIKSRLYEKGKHLHKHMLERGYRNVFLMNLVVRMYGACGKLDEARSAFESIAYPNTYSWNMIIAAYVRSGLLKEAEEMYERMPEKDVVADTTMITAYSKEGDALRARKIFDGMEEKNVVSWTAMISAYAKSGDVQAARSLFNNVRRPNSASWNSIITAYAQSEDMEEAKKLFDKMPRPNLTSWNTILTAYAKQGRVEEARNWFAKMPEKDHISWNAIISAYAEAGRVDEAKKLFEMTDMSHISPCNAMLRAYVKANQGEQALKLYSNMSLQGLRIDPNSIVPALVACSNLSRVQAIHGSLAESYIPDDDVEVNVALICAYSKHGELDPAKSLFDVKKMDIDRWNAMLSAYTHNRQGEQALKLFEEMNLFGVVPNELTLVLVLSSYSTIDEGTRFFRFMEDEIALQPNVEHYLCMVELLARVDKLRMAEELVNSMPFEPCFAAWITLLQCCKLCNDIKVATRAAVQAIKLEPENPVPYKVLASILTAGGDERAAKRVIKRMKERIGSSK